MGLLCYGWQRLCPNQANIGITSTKNVLCNDTSEPHRGEYLGVVCLIIIIQVYQVQAWMKLLWRCVDCKCEEGSDWRMKVGRIFWVNYCLSTSPIWINLSSGIHSCHTSWMIDVTFYPHCSITINYYVYILSKYIIWPPSPSSRVSDNCHGIHLLLITHYTYLIH